MSEQTREALLRHAAERAAERPFFLASALAVYQEEHALDDAALADLLGCEPAQLRRLRLCRRPDPDAARFNDDVKQIAAYAGVQPLRLLTLLREADALAALRDASQPTTTLLAARDKDDSDENSRQ